jgi:hypothetical protein
VTNRTNSLATFAADCVDAVAVCGRNRPVVLVDCIEVTNGSGDLRSDLRRRVVISRRLLLSFGESAHRSLKSMRLEIRFSRTDTCSLDVLVVRGDFVDQYADQHLESSIRQSIIKRKKYQEVF